ncbi:hypothetical protein LJC41_04360, partial [Desulfosarcina sp. OttesenSCG-928-G17]|nr:hypothetical protein [Desulfosarcina sp. OttesenSCG-928-G17]
MPTVSHTAFSDYLTRTPAADWPQVTLIYGEELLVQQAAEGLLTHLVPQSRQSMDVEGFDGAESDMAAVMANLNTYALFSAQKVVMLRDARIFYSTQVKDSLRDKAAQAAQKGEMKKASRSFLSLLSVLGLSLDDLTTP